MQLRPPANVPVMTLPNTVFFPGIALPLHIFEPRYRVMLADVLKTHRMFAVAALDSRNIAFPENPEPLHRMATAGVIRACRTSADGTSDLILEGLTRVRVRSIKRESPYRMVSIETVQSQSAEPAHELENLRQDLLHTIHLRARLPMAMPPSFEAMMRNVDDPSEACDITVFALSSETGFKQRMLETIDPAVRLRETISELRRELAQCVYESELHRVDDDDAALN